MIKIDFLLVFLGLGVSFIRFGSLWIGYKSSHFFLLMTNYSTEDYAKLYLAEIVKLYGAIIFIIFDYGTFFLISLLVSISEILRD